MVFVDAQEMSKKYPETFAVPSNDDLCSLVPGDYVKVCALNKERFWVQLTTVAEDFLTGVVSNDLVEVPLKFGETVSFFKCNVYCIMKQEQAVFYEGG